MSLTIHPIIDCPQSLILEAAVGLDPFDEICARHGYTEDQTNLLRNDPGFAIRVSKVQADLRKDGITLRMRAAHAAEDLVGDIWSTAKRSDTSLALKIEAAKLLAKLGDVEPKQNIQANSGPGFSVVINIPGQAPLQVGTTIDVTPTELVDEPQPEFRLSHKNNDLRLPENYEYEE